MGLITAWRRWRAKSQDETKSLEVGQYQIAVLMKGDGFIPITQFQGRDLKQTLEAAAWSYACITANAETVASLPGIVQRKGKPGEGRWVEDPDHQLNELIASPMGNGGPPRWAWGQWVETVVQQILLCGNSYQRQVVTGNRLTALPILLKPTIMDATLDASGYPSSYKHGSEQYLPSEIVNVQNCHPDNFWKGQNPTQTAWDDIATDRTARDRQKYNMVNRIGANLVFKVDSWWGGTDEQEKRIGNKLAEEYQGATKEGVPLILGKNIDIEKLPDTDLGRIIVDTRDFSRQGILAVYRTPPPIVGVYDNATLQNFREATKIWWMIGLFPLLHTIYNAINAQAIQPIYGRDVRLWYDLTGSEIGLLMLDARVDVALKLMQLGYPSNMCAARVGLDMKHVPELDVPNVNMIVAGRET